MSAGWKALGAVSLLQMLLTFFHAFRSFIDLFTFSDGYYLFATIAYILMACLSILTLSLLKNNFPDEPVAGKQKRSFNWLFLLNFLLLMYNFGLIFAKYIQLKEAANLLDSSVTALPFYLFIPFLINLALLVFQLIILYGLYSLRQYLYANFRKKEFEFEKGV